MEVDSITAVDPLVVPTEARFGASRLVSSDGLNQFLLRFFWPCLHASCSGCDASNSLLVASGNNRQPSGCEHLVVAPVETLF